MPFSFSHFIASAGTLATMRWIVCCVVVDDKDALWKSKSLFSSVRVIKCHQTTATVRFSFAQNGFLQQLWALVGRCFLAVPFVCVCVQMKYNKRKFFCGFNAVYGGKNAVSKTIINEDLAPLWKFRLNSTNKKYFFNQNQQHAIKLCNLYRNKGYIIIEFCCGPL